jgi:predicted thioesterase
MAASAGKPDKRKQKRVRRKLRVLLHVDNQHIKGMTADLSAGGLLVTCAHILLPGTKLTGQLFLSEDEALPFEAQVRWSRNSTRWLATDIQHSLGLEFTRPPGAVYLGYLEVSSKSSITVAAVRANTKPPPMRNQTAAGQPELRHTSGVHSSRHTSGVHPARPTIEIAPVPPGRTPVPPMNTPPPLARSQPPVLTPSPAPRVPSPVPLVRTMTPAPVAPEPSPPEPNISVDEPFPQVNAGLTGVARGNASSSQKREQGSSPLAPSTAAGLIERAAVKALGDHLPPGFRTVGFALDIELRKPPLVKLGTTLEARATLVRLQPDRTLVFTCEVRQDDQLIASGQHCRLIMEIGD